MALGRSAAVVIGRFPLGESDRVVTFFSREFGKVRGVARGARRMRSKFGSALELFTLGELIFFDAGRSDLVRIDHFDITHPFARLREDLERLGRAGWIVEVVGRLTAEHDRQPALYGLLVRGLTAVEQRGQPARAAVCFGIRCLDVLGHRPRLDACGRCGRVSPFPRASLGDGGVLCQGCTRAEPGAVPASGGALAALGRLREMAWDEALRTPLGAVEAEVGMLVEAYVSRLIGQPTRTTRFMREVERLGPTAKDAKGVSR